MNFIVGCTESGQVVLWDLRNGSRFPVQKSRLSYSSVMGETVSGQGGGGGHSIVGMEFILQEVINFLFYIYAKTTNSKCSSYACVGCPWLYI